MGYALESGAAIRPRANTEYIYPAIMIIRQACYLVQTFWSHGRRE